MHIEIIHDMIEKLVKCADAELNKGVDNLDAEEFGKVTDMIKDLNEAEYYASITKAMEESEYGEDYDYQGRMYYDNYRYMRTGRYAPKGKGTYVGRRGYDEPYYKRMGYNDRMYMDSKMQPDYRMDVDDYRTYTPMQLREEDYRRGRMYYTDSNMSSNGNMVNGNIPSGNMSSNTRNYQGNMESNYDRAKRNYTETRENHKSNTADDKTAKMRELETYMGELTGDLTDLIKDMTQEEKSLAKNKLIGLANKM